MMKLALSIFHMIYPAMEHGKSHMTGTEFLSSIENVSYSERDDIAVKAIIAGDVPDFLRTFTPVFISDGVNEGMIWVAADYLAIGTNDDYVYIPMSPKAAQTIASEFGAILPTTKIVDYIYDNAQMRLKPTPMMPTSEMRSVSYIKRHTDLIHKKTRKVAVKLLAGHKKDVVISNLLCNASNVVAIYGWHQDVGSVIQPLGVPHDDAYSDYSHGVRLVANFMVLNGELRMVSEVLRSEQASILSDEGTMCAIKY